MRSSLLVSVWFCTALLPASARSAPAVPAKRVVVGPGVVVEIAGAQRRVIVSTQVCLRMGPLEGLLTRQKKKEHEYILAADIDARHIHTALILAGAKPGSPVQFAPVYRAASGARIRVLLRYMKGGKAVTVPAREWIRHARTGKPLDQDWVFAGSRFVPNPENPKVLDYIANHGDVVCVCNMESAILDLPVPSPKRFDSRIYEADTARIPEAGTKVEVILEPVTLPKPGNR